MKVIAPILIGAAIIGAAFLTGGASLVPSLTSVATVGGVTVTSVIAGGLATTALGGLALAMGASLVVSGVLGAVAGTPKVTAAQTERLNMSSNPDAFRVTILGETAFGNDVRWQEWHGAKQDITDIAVANTSHRVESLDAIYINGELAWSPGTDQGVGKFAGYLFVNFFAEGGPGQGMNFESGRWTQAHSRLTGCAWTHLRFVLSGKNSPFSSGVPSAIRFIGKGAPLYDPRHDSTVIGGDGAMRADDQTTWRFFDVDGAPIGKNLPLQILRVLLGGRIQNPTTGAWKLATGCGIPKKRLALETFLVAANLADEMVTKSDGTFESRYHGAAAMNEGDDPNAALDMLCAACNGRLIETGGKLGLLIAHNDLALAAADDGLTDDDVIGDFVWNPDPGLDMCPNVVSGKYTDPSVNSLYQPLPYREARLPSLDGIDRVFPLDLAAVESPSQAERVSSQVLERKQYDRTFTAPFDITAWRYGIGILVPFTFKPLGFVRRIFRVVEQELTADGSGACNMMLRVESPAIYAWDGGQGAIVTPADPIVYDTRNNPLLVAITTRAAYRFVTQTVAYPLGSDDDTVTIAAFSGVLDDGRSIDLAAGAVDGLDPGTLYGIFYRLADGAYLAVPAPANAEMASADYAFINFQSTSDSGVFPPEITPPGGYGGTGPCLIESEPLLLANDDRTGPGVTIALGEARAGMWVWTRHHETRREGAYRITRASRVWQPLVRAEGRPVGTASHLFGIEGGWLSLGAIGAPCGEGWVVKLTVEGAETYQTLWEGEPMLHHNKRDTSGE